MRPPHWPRWVNRIYARLRGYFWLRCPLCGAWFGGHEAGRVVQWTGPGEGLIACWRHRGERPRDSA